MKTPWFPLLALSGALVSSQAASIFEATYPVESGLLPDGDLNGRVDVRRVTGVGGTVLDVDVRVVIAGAGPDGGWVGDLYGTLQHESGLAVLLNRPGRGAGDEFGASGGGIDVWFDDSAAGGDVHLLMDGDATHTGSWAPDGRTVLPTALPTAFEGAGRPALLSSLLGLPVDGVWTLLMVDASSGGLMELQEWGIRIEYEPSGPYPGDPVGTGPVVPEAGSWWVAGAGILAGALGRQAVRRRASAQGAGTARAGQRQELTPA